MHAGLTVSLRTVAPPRRGEHVLGEGALGTERGRRPGADVARRLFRYRGETVDRMPTARLQNWGGRTRTSNFPVNSRAVCQLTYTPMCPTTTPPTVNRLQKTDAQTRSGEQITQAEKRAPPKPLGAGGARSPSLRATPPGPPDSGDWCYRCDLRPDRRTSA